MRRSRVSPIHCALLFTLAAASSACEKTTTIVLVRHAERPPGTDPDLNVQGQQRARALADVLAQASVSVIYHSQFKRTKQTGDTLAVEQSIPMVEYNVAGGQEQQHADDLVAEILDSHAGRTVLVIGHSNTVPVVIETLGVANAPAIPDTVYNNLFVVVKRSRSAGRLIHARYGQ